MSDATRCRRATQRIVERLGSVGPESLEGAVERLVARLDVAERVVPPNWARAPARMPDGRVWVTAERVAGKVRDHMLSEADARDCPLDGPSERRVAGFIKRAVSDVWGVPR